MSIVKTHKMKRNDLQPHYRFAVPDSTDLTGATFTCTMINVATKALVITRGSAGCVVTSGIDRQLEYRWQDGDTAAAGIFKIEFEVNPVSGGKFTVPVTGSALVQIGEDLDGQ